jgi:2-oxoisovalerate dehydrogenase E1 component
VLFLEPKHLYRQPHNRSADPGPDYTIPFGCASRPREGTDLTLITYGSTVALSVRAAATIAAEDGAEIEVIDLRSLSPYDWPAIARSVEKTSRALVVHEDWASWGYGAEIAARIGDELFQHLDAPVRRVGAEDVFCGYHPTLEAHTLPQTADIVSAARSLLAF